MQLVLQGPEDVQAMGIGEYNKQCRKIVMRYSTEWEVSDYRPTSATNDKLLLAILFQSQTKLQLHSCKNPENLYVLNE